MLPGPGRRCAAVPAVVGCCPPQLRRRAAVWRLAAGAGLVRVGRWVPIRGGGGSPGRLWLKACALPCHRGSSSCPRAVVPLHAWLPFVPLALFRCRAVVSGCCGRRSGPGAGTVAGLRGWAVLNAEIRRITARPGDEDDVRDRAAEEPAEDGASDGTGGDRRGCSGEGDEHGRQGDQQGEAADGLDVDAVEQDDRRDQQLASGGGSPGRIRLVGQDHVRRDPGTADPSWAPVTAL